MNGAAYILMVVGILLAKGLGFFRDIFFARIFGASEFSDIYLTIFTVVNLIFTGIGTAMQTLVIKHMNRGENALRQKEFVTKFIRSTCLVLLAVTAVMYAFARPLTKMLVPGVSAKNFGLALNITYVMLPSLIFVVVAYIISGVLQNNRVFFITSIMSLPFNVILIAALFFPGIDIFTLSVITTTGWFLHIVVQLPQFYRLGFRLFTGSAKVKLGLGGNVEVLLIFISSMMFQVCFLLDRVAVNETAGASTLVSYSSNLFVTIASVFVVAMSSVVFPSISQNYEEGSLSYVRGLIRYIIVTMFAIFTPFVLTTCCFGQNVISLVYERGQFTPDLTPGTAMLFAVYTLGVLGYMAQELFNKVLYLGAKYQYTVIGTAIVIIIKLLTNNYIADKGGTTAVAVSTTVLFTLYAAMVAIAMKNVIGSFINRELLISVGKVLLSGGLALGAFFLMRLLFPGFTAVRPGLFESAIMNKVIFIAPLFICGAVYIGALFALGAAKEIISRPAANISDGGKENE